MAKIYSVIFLLRIPEFSFEKLLRNCSGSILYISNCFVKNDSITNEYFKGKYVQVDGEPVMLDDAAANDIEFYLIQNGYVDMSRKVTDKYRADVKLNTLAPLPLDLQPMADGIHQLIQAVYDDSVLEDMFINGRETKVKDNPLNDNFYKKEFQALWKEINHKYAS